ncbi:general substrate transporter [Rhizodiscina lignyota]|uniref:General substrate transporter n=1 Tax=Rhizodiscina lignyota TaxID=1504668 RepID=A0A9P4MAE9_9PEZI|nr:general substrate transporter [Rhizodiscina lignyota]
MAPYFGLRGSKLHTAIWAEAFFSVMIFGYNQAAAGGVLTTASFARQFPKMDVLDTTGAQQKHNSTIQGTVIAMYTLMGTFGALTCTVLGDKIGRRWTIFLACIFNAIGGLLQGTSFSFAQFIVSRLVLGFGTGGIIATVSVWQSELSKAESRGSHVSAFGIFCGSGLSLALWVDFGMSYVKSSASWRFPLTFPIVLSAIVMSTIMSMPESPRWLMKVGRTEEAREIMQILHEDPETVEKEIADIQASLDLSGNVSLKSLLEMGPQRTFHRVLIASTVQMFLQMTGVNSITYYASSIYESDLDFPAKTAEILAAASQLVIILGSVICSVTVDRFGRRTLMLFSATAMCLCFAAMTGLVSNPNNHSALKAAVFVLYLYYLVYCIGFLGIPFLYASEIAPAKQRAAICGVSTAVSWLFNFLVAEVTPVGFTDIKWRYFIVYCALNAAFVPCIYFFFPETKGRSLEEIDEIFTQSRNIFDPVKVAKRLPHKHLADFVREDVEGKPQAPVTEQVEDTKEIKEDL